MALRNRTKRLFPSDPGSLLVLALALCAVAMLWTFVLVSVEIARARDHEKAREDAFQVATLIDGETARIFDVTLVALDRAVDALAMADPSHRFREILESLQASHPEITSVALLEANGHGTVTTLAGMRPFDGTANENVVFHHADPTRLPYISLPFAGSSSGAPRIAVSRQIDGDDRRTARIVAVTLDYGHVERMLHDARLGPNGTIALHRLDRVLFARAANLDMPVGRSTADAAVWRHYPQSTAAVFEVASSRVDGLRRIVAFRRVRNLPFLAVATIAEADLEARAAEIARTPFRAAAAGSLALAALGLMGMYQAGRSHRLRRIATARRIVAERARTRAQRARAEAETANRAKSAFLANMSHELRTPLNAVMGFAETIRGGYVEATGPRTREYAGNIVGSGERLVALVDELLDAAELGSSHLPLEGEDVDPRAIVERAAAELSFAFAQRRIAFETAGDCGGPVRLNRRALQQIFKALLANAARYVPPDGHVRVTFARADGWIEVRVADDGPGLPAEIAGRIGEPFLHAGSPMTASGSGPGIGLWVVRTLVERQRGSFAVESVPGNGTTFVLRFPAG